MGEDRIEQHVFRFVEKELFRYMVNKSLVASWEQERKSITDESHHVFENARDRVPQNKITNPTESKVMRIMSMASKVDRARWYCQAIEDVLKTLPPEDKRLVELKYFQGILTNTGVAKELHISRSEYYNRRNRIIEKFGIRMGLM